MEIKKRHGTGHHQLGSRNTLYKILSRASLLLKILVNVASKLFSKNEKGVKR